MLKGRFWACDFFGENASSYTTYISHMMCGKGFWVCLMHLTGIGLVRLKGWDFGHSEGDLRVCLDFGTSEGTHTFKASYEGCLVKSLGCWMTGSWYGHVGGLKVRFWLGLQSGYVSWWKFEGKAGLYTSNMLHIVCEAWFCNCLVTGS